ncbi:MAG: NAD-dependent dihydropyrimidine dehydrogenase subunit PreA [Persicimonas sp.]
MPDLSVNFAGIESPNPFWLASAPPANSGEQVMRAFDAGWGGAVWKTLGQPITNVSSRFGALDYGDTPMVGFNNIELITDRPLEDNFREIEEVKRHYPDHAVVVSLMVESREEWKDIIERSVEAGADGLELNFGCPHGMCERGMGSAVGQEPKVCEEITSWAVEFSEVPVIVKLTPNVGDIVPPGLAAARGGADAVSLINTVKSIIGVDLERGVIEPPVDDKSSNGGYCGQAVRPIALHMVNQLAQDRQFDLPISGIGGVETWRDALEFVYLGASTVQVCTAVMHHGYRIVRDMIDGTERFMRDKGFETIDEMVGEALPSYADWGDLDLNYERVAKIDDDLCIGCQKCVVACHDGAHQCIHVGEESRVPYVDESECIGCNLCNYVCPVPDCITMERVDNGKPSMSWNQYVENKEKGEDVEHPGKSTHHTHF